MPATRTQKNLALSVVNLILAPILWLKIYQEPESVGAGRMIWAMAAPLICIGSLWTSAWDVGKVRRFAKPLHVALFLATGAALGLTLGASLRDFDSLWLGEVLWLPLGVAAAVFHYSPSVNDEYQ